MVGNRGVAGPVVGDLAVVVVVTPVLDPPLNVIFGNTLVTPPPHKASCII